MYRIIDSHSPLTFFEVSPPYFNWSFFFRIIWCARPCISSIITWHKNLANNFCIPIMLKGSLVTKYILSHTLYIISRFNQEFIIYIYTFNITHQLNCYEKLWLHLGLHQHVPLLVAFYNYAWKLILKLLNSCLSPHRHCNIYKALQRRTRNSIKDKLPILILHKLIQYYSKCWCIPKSKCSYFK